MKKYRVEYQYSPTMNTFTTITAVDVLFSESWARFVDGSGRTVAAFSAHTIYRIEVQQS